MKKLHTESLETRSLLAAAAAEKEFSDSFVDSMSSFLSSVESYAPFIKDVREHPIPAVTAGLSAALAGINAYHAFGHTLSAVKNGIPKLTTEAGVDITQSENAKNAVLHGANDATIALAAVSVPGDKITFAHVQELINTFHGSQDQLIKGKIVHVLENMMHQNLIVVQNADEAFKLANTFETLFAFDVNPTNKHLKKLNFLVNKIDNDPANKKLIADITSQLQKEFGIGKPFGSEAILEDTIEVLENTEEELKDNGAHILNSFINVFSKGDTTFLSEWGTFIGAGIALPKVEKWTGNPLHKLFGIDGAMELDSAYNVFKNSNFQPLKGYAGAALQYGFTADAIYDTYNDTFESLLPYEKQGPAKTLSDMWNFAWYNPMTSFVKTGGWALDNYMFARFLPGSGDLVSKLPIPEIASVISQGFYKLPGIPTLASWVGRSIVSNIPGVGTTVTAAGASLGWVVPVVLAMDIAYPVIEDAATRVDKFWNYKDEGYDTVTEAVKDLSYRFCTNIDDNLWEGWDKSKIKRLGNLGINAAVGAWNYGIFPALSSMKTLIATPKPHTAAFV